MLNRFEFVVEPMIYGGTHGGTEKIYRVTIRADGEQYGITKVLSEEVPTHMSELEYLMDRAIVELQHAIAAKYTETPVV